MVERSFVGFTANWLWYLGRGAGGTALDASDSPGPLALELASHFSKVHILRQDRSALDEIAGYLAPARGPTSPGAPEEWPYALTLGSILSAPWSDQTFDCVAVHDAFAGCDPKAAETLETLRRIRGLLRPEGWFVGGSLNPSYPRHPRPVPVGMSAPAFSRLLVEAQFREVRRLFVTPSVDRPRALIPDARRTVRAYEAFDSIGGSTSWTRRVVAGLRLHRLLYPAYLVMARA